jgi:hypothetical protein
MEREKDLPAGRGREGKGREDCSAKLGLACRRELERERERVIGEHL